MSPIETELESRYRAVLDALPYLVSYITHDERYGMVNQAHVPWFGVEPAEVVGKPISAFISPAVHAQLIPHIRRSLGGERVTFEQHDVPYRGDGLHDFRFDFVPHLAPDGTVLGTSARLEDITLRRRHAKSETEARIRTEFLLELAAALGETLDLEVVLQRLVDGIAPARAGIATVWDTTAGEVPKRRVHAPFNATLTEAKELPAADAVARASARPVAWAVATGTTQFIPNYEAWMANAGEPDVGRAIAALGVEAALLVPIRRGSEIVAVLAVTRPSGTTFDSEDVALFESAAQLAGLAYENARLFGETARLRQAAEDATVAKDAFLARVSHDLRNPLNSILGWSGLLRTMKEPAQIARGIDVIERNAKAQVQLIEDLLDVSRIAMGKLALSLSVEDVRDALDTSLDAARLAADAKKVKLEIVIDEDVGWITVDRDRFRQIVWNLVANAVKFTPEAGTVRVSARRLASSLEIIVSRHGPRDRAGVPAEGLLRVRAGRGRSPPRRWSRARPRPRDRQGSRRASWRNDRRVERGGRPWSDVHGPLSDPRRGAPGDPSAACSPRARRGPARRRRRRGRGAQERDDDPRPSRR